MLELCRDGMVPARQNKFARACREPRSARRKRIMTRIRAITWPGLDVQYSPTDDALIIRTNEAVIELCMGGGQGTKETLLILKRAINFALKDIADTGE